MRVYKSIQCGIIYSCIILETNSTSNSRRLDEHDISIQLIIFLITCLIMKTISHHGQILIKTIQILDLHYCYHNVNMEMHRQFMERTWTNENNRCIHVGKLQVIFFPFYHFYSFLKLYNVEGEKYELEGKKKLLHF